VSVQWRVQSKEMFTQAAIKTFMEYLIAKLPPDTSLAIYRDAVLMHLWQRQCEQVQWWAGPVFYLWAKITHYERQWPGSTEAHAAVAWE